MASLRFAIPMTLALLLAACAGGGDRDTPPIRVLPASPNGELLGMPTPDENRYWQALDPWFAAADTDKDSRLSAEELMADAARLFPTFDSDGDGFATSAELTRYRIESPYRFPTLSREERRQRLAELSPEERERLRGNVRGVRPRSQLDPVMSADANADFRVSLTELQAQAAGIVAADDRDGDGRLSMTELVRGQLLRVRAEPRDE